MQVDLLRILAPGDVRDDHADHLLDRARQLPLEDGRLELLPVRRQQRRVGAHRAEEVGDHAEAKLPLDLLVGLARQRIGHERGIGQFETCHRSSFYYHKYTCGEYTTVSRPTIGANFPPIADNGTTYFRVQDTVTCHQRAYHMARTY